SRLAASGYSTESRDVRTGSTTSGPGPTSSPRVTELDSAPAGAGVGAAGADDSIRFGTEIALGVGELGSIATGIGTGAAFVGPGAPAAGDAAARSPVFAGFAFACFSSSFCFSASCFLTSSSTWLSVSVVDAGGGAALEVAGAGAGTGGFAGADGALER